MLLLKSSHGRDGRLTFRSSIANTGRRCFGPGWLRDHLIVHHKWEPSSKGVRSCSEAPIAPCMGIPADLPKSTLIFKFGSIFGSIRDMYVLATPASFPSPRWENCAPMGDSRFARCLQGGGVRVFENTYGATVSIVNSQIYSNTALYVRADIRNFPSP